jgi:hypothetical protein
MTTTQLQRDPFARATLVRYSVPVHGTCSGCGNGTARYVYRWEADGQRLPRYTVHCTDAKAFCSVGCWRDYNGGAR